MGCVFIVYIYISIRDLIICTDLCICKLWQDGKSLLRIYRILYESRRSNHHFLISNALFGCRGKTNERE